MSAAPSNQATPDYGEPHRRRYDALALHLMSEYPKVLQVLNNETPIPSVLEVFPTNFCSYNCPHCRCRAQHGDKSEYMRLNVMEALLTELAASGVRAVELSGGGEPLEHPDIHNVLKCVRENGMHVGVITNGHALATDNTLINDLCVCAHWLRISVDGFTDETYRKVHGTQALYSTVKSSLQVLTSTREELPKLGLKILISKLNYQDVPFAIEQALEIGANYLQFKFLGFPQHLVLDDADTDVMLKTLGEQLEKHKDTLTIDLVPAYKGGNDKGQKCRMTFLHPVVDWDGTIYICAFFEHRKNQHSIGNIHDGGFFRHWNDPKHWAAYNAIDPSTCIPNCPMRRYEPIVEYIRDNEYIFPYV